jgi:hypothetical protein
MRTGGDTIRRQGGVGRLSLAAAQRRNPDVIGWREQYVLVVLGNADVFQLPYCR